jgi:hypothetical protein
MASTTSPTRAAFGVRADYHGVCGATIVQQYLDCIGARDHVVVGEDMAINGHDHTRAQGAFDALTLGLGAGKLAEIQIVQQGIATGRYQLGGVDIDHRGCGRGHGPGVAYWFLGRADRPRVARQYPAVKDQQGCQQPGDGRPGDELQAFSHSGAVSRGQYYVVCWRIVYDDRTRER